MLPSNCNVLLKGFPAELTKTGTSGVCDIISKLALLQLTKSSISTSWEILDLKQAKAITIQ